MGEKSPKQNRETADVLPPSEVAINSALTGYANNGGSWKAGKHVFNDRLERGDRIDQALHAALKRTENDAKSTSEEAEGRFWQQLPVEAALEAALTGYAHNGGSWKLAKHVFFEARERGLPVGTALEAALDSAESKAKTTAESAAEKFWEAVQNPPEVEKKKVKDEKDKKRENREEPRSRSTRPEQARRRLEEKREREPYHLSVGVRERESSYHAPGFSEDFVINDQKRGIFGVFDGMGGVVGDPRAASHQAGRAAHNSLARDGHRVKEKQEIYDSLGRSFRYARQAVNELKEGGSTVGTMMRFFDLNGKLVVGIAHAGDTRLFKYRPSTGQYFPITSDQSMGNMVYNSMSPGSHSSKSDEYLIDSDVRPGDKYMICSDGITGDWGPDNPHGIPNQFLSDQEMLSAFGQRTPGAAAQRFLDVSKKDDDKSVIVVEV